MQVLMADLAKGFPGFLTPKKVRGHPIRRIIFCVDIMAGCAGQFPGQRNRHVGRNCDMFRTNIHGMHIALIKEILMAAGGAEDGDGSGHSTRGLSVRAVRYVTP
jgi:hypothetical protein